MIVAMLTGKNARVSLLRDEYRFNGGDLNSQSPVVNFFAALLAISILGKTIL